MVAERHDPEPVKRRFTREEYLEFDANAEWKYEFVDGRVYPVGWPDVEVFPDDVTDRPEEIHAMAGGSREHNSIARATFLSLAQQLRGSPCEPFSSDTRVKMSEAGGYAYPDIMIACGPEFTDDKLETLSNPVVIIEVLSPSTAAYDHTGKWALYRHIPSLQDYLMISTDAPRVERYSRRGADGPGAWYFDVLEGLDIEIVLPSIDCTLRLSEVYQRVNFQTDATEQAGSAQGEKR